MSRELPREEKATIRKLVTKWCANYDKEYGCLLGLGFPRKQCWASAGRGPFAATSGRPFCPLILCWRPH